MLGERSMALPCSSEDSLNLVRIFRGRAGCSANAGWTSHNSPNVKRRSSVSDGRTPTGNGLAPSIVLSGDDGGDHWPLPFDPSLRCEGDFRAKESTFRIAHPADYSVYSVLPPKKNALRFTEARQATLKVTANAGGRSYAINA